jgi:hypothetical protein
MQGANVICVDNYFTGTRRNIETMLDHHRFEVIRHDVTFPFYIETDQIYNLACPASPVHRFGVGVAGDRLDWLAFPRRPQAATAG